MHQGVKAIESSSDSKASSTIDALFPSVPRGSVEWLTVSKHNNSSFLVRMFNFSVTV